MSEQKLKSVRVDLTCALVQLNAARLSLAEISHLAESDVAKAISKANLALQRVKSNLEKPKPQNVRRNPSGS